MTLLEKFTEQELEQAYSVATKINDPIYSSQYSSVLVGKIQNGRFFKIDTEKIVNPAAEVVEWGASAIKGKRGEVLTNVGELFPISRKMSVNAQELSGLNADTKKELTRLYEDVQGVIQSIRNRFEFVFLQALSNGVSTMEQASNANGVAYSFDYKIPEEQLTGASVVWTATATADPLKDLRERIQYAKINMRVTPAFIYMDATTVGNLLNADKTKALILAIAVGKISTSHFVSLNEVNAYLSGQGMPTIIEVNDNIPTLNAEGTIDNTAKAWKTGNIAFVPAGKLGRIAYVKAPEASVQTVTGSKYSESGIFSIIQAGRLDPAGIETIGKVYGYPVIDRMLDVMIMNTLKTTFL